MKAMIFDIDGTLANVTSISHLIDGYDFGTHPKEFFDEYHEKSVSVPAVEWIAAEVRKALDDGYAVFIVTARKIMYAQQTADFLGGNDIPCTGVFMRRDDDNRPDHEYKLDVLNTIKHMGYIVEKAYDDNPAIIELWKSHGIMTVFVQGYGFKYSVSGE